MSFSILTMFLALFATLQFCVESLRYIHLSYVMGLLNPLSAQISTKNNYILCWKICHDPKNIFLYSYLFCVVLTVLKFHNSMFSLLLHMCCRVPSLLPPKYFFFDTRLKVC